MAYEQFRVKISGDVLLLHNGQLADPLNKFAKAMKAVSGRRNKTESDYEQMAQLEYEGSLYLDKGKVVVDSRVLEAAICVGAKKSKEGKLALSSVFVDTPGALSYAGGPLSVEELVKSEAHRLTVAVRVQNSRVMRTRPMFRDWSAEFKVSLLADIASEEQLSKWLADAGSLTGIGDYRPRYGRFTVTEFEKA